MKDVEKLYFPLHYKWVSIIEEISDEEFGRLIRALLAHFYWEKEPQDLPKHLQVAYRFILDAAERVLEKRERASEHSRKMATARWGDKVYYNGKERIRAGNFDPEEAFQRALKRSREQKDDM